MGMNADLEKWIEKVKKCEHLAEEELKALCDYVKEILIEESNVQPVNAPVGLIGDRDRAWWSPARGDPLSCAPPGRACR